MEKLKDLFSDLSFTPDAVVLGCTHYPHIRGALRRYFGETVPLYDGGQGTARRAKELLEERGLLRENGTEGTVTITTSSDDPAISLLARRLLRA